MFDFLFAQPRSAKTRRANRRKFQFESLETRNCPSGMPMGPMEPPMISMNPAQVGTGQTVNISGQVQDFNPGGLPAQVTLSGVVAATVTTDSSGGFSYQGPASSLGTVIATATDADGLSSPQPTSTSVVDPGPTLTSFSITYVPGSGNEFTVSGDVQSPSGLSLPVTFAGCGLGVRSINANGSFSVQTTAAGSGTVTATATDVWGVSTSVQTSLTVPPPPPEITSFEATYEGNERWVLSGTVSDQDPSGIKVQFSGVVSASSTTDSSGNFSTTIMAPQNLNGDEFAVAEDSWGQTSNTAETYM